jgi:DNA (cytosine-5)-methyltransferase 1
VSELATPIQEPLFEVAGDLRVDYAREGDRVIQTIECRGDRFESRMEVPVASGSPESDWWLGFLRGAQRELVASREKIGAIDLFAGPGGLTLGAGIAASSLGLAMREECAIDIDSNSLGIFRANHRPRLWSDESVASLVGYRLGRNEDGTARFSGEPKVFDKRIAALRGSLTLMLAGPPCQGHSTANNRTRFNDPRNLLYLSAPAMAVALDVPAVVIENVPGVTASKEGVAKTAVELLESSGYSVTTKVLASDRLGWPQTRRRFFVVATKGWEPVPLELVDQALASEPRPISWALKDVLESDEDSVMTEVPDLSEESKRRIDFLHDNDLYDLPLEERPDCHKDGTTYRAMYGRMRWDAPAQTITTGFMTPGRGRYVHPIERRPLNPREAARLQGFPDSYRFEHLSGPIGRSPIAKAIGEAVPSPLGFAAVLAALANRP